MYIFQLLVDVSYAKLHIFLESVFKRYCIFAIAQRKVRFCLEFDHRENEISWSNHISKQYDEKTTVQIKCFGLLLAAKEQTESLELGV